MSWYELLGIYELAADEQRDNQEQPPTACPNDGEPLDEGPNGELHCPFDGWIWNGF